MRFVTRREEARQDQFGHDRIADNDLLSILPQRGFAPRHRHQPKRAVEVRDVDRDHRAPAAHFHDVGDNRDGARWHDGEAFAADGVTALPRRCRRAEVRVEQAAVIVAHVDAEGATAEEVIYRVRAFVARDAEDALVHHRDRHAHTLAARRTADA